MYLVLVSAGLRSERDLVGTVDISLGQQSRVSGTKVDIDNDWEFAFGANCACRDTPRHRGTTEALQRHADDLPSK